MFATGEATALMIAPALMTLLVVTWGQPGWLALAAIFLVAPDPRHARHSLGAQHSVGARAR